LIRSLSLNEGFLYGLDTLPLFLALVVYVPIYPGIYLGARASRPISFAALGSTDGHSKSHSMPLKATGSPSSY
jgi:hypothetical protein